MIQDTDDAENELEYRKFRKLLLRHRHYNSCLACGSCFELPLQYVLNNMTDIDKMYWIRNTEVCQNDDNLETQKFSKTILKIDSSGCPSGFSRLKKLRNYSGDEFYRKPCPPLEGPYSGPSWQRILDFGSNSEFCKMCLTNFSKNWRNLSELKIDMVYSVYCPTWPLEASEWINRKRKYGWPASDAIEKVVGQGCHLVPKPHPRSEADDTQWRFSFSQAELILIQTWTDFQKYVYHILRLIKRKAVKRDGGEETSFLCTYYFKTLMLWACEEKPRDFWREQNLKCSLEELLCQMIEWLIERHCPNYFIPDYNMLDHLSSDVSTSQGISFLLYFKEENLSNFLKDVPKSSSKSPLYVSIPNNLIEVALLHLNKACFRKDSEWEFFETCLWASDNFVPQLRYLFQSIQAQLRLTDGQSSTHRKTPFRGGDVNTVLKYLSLAKSRPIDTCVSFSIFPLCHSIMDLKNQLEILCRPHKKKSHLNTGVLRQQTNEKRNNSILQYLTYLAGFSNSRPSGDDTGTDMAYSCCYIRDNTFCQRIPETFISDLLLTRDTTGANELEDDIQKLLTNSTNDWSSPTYFVAECYEANFFFALMYDYRSAVDRCKKAFRYLDWLKENFMQSAAIVLVTNAFDVVIKNDWSLLFDINIQIILGFLTLCSAVCHNNRENRRRNIAIYIRPLEFLRYVYFQSVRQIGGSESVSYQCDFKGVVRDLFYEECDNRGYSRIILLTAIRISGIQPQKIDQNVYNVRWPD